MKIINQNRIRQDETIDHHLRMKLFQAVKEKTKTSADETMHIISLVIQELDKDFIALIRR